MHGQGHPPGQQGLTVPQQRQAVKRKTSATQLADIRDRLQWPEFSGLNDSYVSRYKKLAEDYKELQPTVVNNLVDNCIPTAAGSRRQTLRKQIDELQGEVETQSDLARKRHADRNAFSIRSGWTGPLSAPSFGTINSLDYAGQAGAGSSAATTPTMKEYAPTAFIGGNFAYLPGATHQGLLKVQGQEDSTVNVCVDARGNLAYHTSHGWWGLVRIA